MTFLRLCNRFILRALWREKTRSTVAALGIGLGVAVMIAIRLANISVTETFRAAVDSVGGNASLRIRGSGGRFDEQLFAELDAIRGYGQLSPVIEAYAMVGDPTLANTTLQEGLPRGEILHVLGVDVLLDFPPPRLSRGSHGPRRDTISAGSAEVTGRSTVRDPDGKVLAATSASRRRDISLDLRIPSTQTSASAACCWTRARRRRWTEISR